MLTRALLLSTVLLAQTPAAPVQVPTLTPLLAAQLEAHALRTQLYTQTLSLERHRLDAAIAAEFPGWRLDWNTMRLQPVQKETPE